MQPRRAPNPAAAGRARGLGLRTAFRMARPSFTSTRNSTARALWVFKISGVCLAMVRAMASGVMPDTSWLQLRRAAT